MARDRGCLMDAETAHAAAKAGDRRSLARLLTLIETGEANGVHIGLAYEFQVVPSIPFETHDRIVDYVVTTNEIITCERNRS